MLLGVGTVTGLVLLLAAILKNDLDQKHRTGLLQSNLEAELQLRHFVTTDLLIDLTDDWGPGGPGTSELREWRDHIDELIPSDAARKILDYPLDETPVLREARDQLVDMLDEMPPPEHISSFAVRLTPMVKAIATRTEHSLEEVQKSRLQLGRDYERDADRNALVLLVAGLAGFGVVCTLTGVFFFRVARDVGRLEDRAAEIARGDFAEPFRLDRRDEIGGLGDAINRMAHALAQRESEVQSYRSRLASEERMFALGTFAAGVAHEIANPISAIQGIFDLIRLNLGGDSSNQTQSENSEIVDLFEAEIGRMKAVVSELSEFTHPPSSEIGPIDINSALRSAVALLRFDPRFRDIQVTTDLARSVRVVYGVASQITQIAINLLINAADAIAGPDGVISVSSLTDGDGVLVRVTDNGCGMSDDIQRKVLDPFFTTKPREKGSGLGLPVCQTIIDRHGGTLEIDSRPEHGTTISFWIPSVPDAEVETK